MNKHRGEVDLKLAGEEIVLRPTFEVLAAIEAETGKSLYAVFSEMAEHKSSAQAMVAIIRCSQETPGEKNDIWSAIVETGILDVYTACLQFLSNAMTGGASMEDVDSGEAEGVTAPTTSPGSKKSAQAKRSSGRRKNSGSQHHTISTGP